MEYIIMKNLNDVALLRVYAVSSLHIISNPTIDD